MRFTCARFLLLLMFVWPPAAISAASWTFTYVGQPFNDFVGSFYGEEDRITASITFDSSLIGSSGDGYFQHTSGNPNPLVTDFWMNDGHRTFVFDDPNVSGGFELWIESFQVSDNYYAYLVTPPGNLDDNVMWTLNDNGIVTERAVAAPDSYGNHIPFVAGTWTLVPEPGTSLLVIGGLHGLAGWRRARA